MGSSDTVFAGSIPEFYDRCLGPGLCQGSPLRAEIEARAADRLDEATAAAVAALVRHCGDPVDAAMSTHVFQARG